MPLTDAPRVTIITATYGRGRHVLPTLHSVRGQDFRDWEHLIIGDCCDDDTADAVAPYLDDRTRWINLETRIGSQAGPNNRGIAEARGRYVAFLGHDDVWAPHHLSSGLSRFEQGGADMVVAGLAEHNASDLLPSRICGLYDDAEGNDAAWRHFVPPTGWMLTRDILDRAGPWRFDPEKRRPTDYDYLDRVLESSGQIRSSGRVTAHKLSGTARYLAYLRHESWEQEALQATIDARVADGTYAQWEAELIERAKAAERDMEDTSKRRTAVPTGPKDGVDKRRGLALGTPEPLGAHAEVSQQEGPQLFDWLALLPEHSGFRRTGPNRRNHMLIPVSADGPVRFEVPVIAVEEMDPHAVRVAVNGEPAEVTVTPKTQTGRWTASHILTFQGKLRPDAHSLLLFTQPAETMMMLGPRTRRGIAVGTVQLTPVAP